MSNINTRKGEELYQEDLQVSTAESSTTKWLAFRILNKKANEMVGRAKVQFYIKYRFPQRTRSTRGVQHWTT